MKNKKLPLKIKIVFTFSAMFLMALTKDVGNAEGQGTTVRMVSPVTAVAVVPDNYIYYPSYGVYYNSSRHQYAYLKDKAWVSQPTPQGVSATVLQASPSVKMDFHDAPANHHAAMVKMYPKNWAPAAAHHDQK
jgi:hypothetical protein